LQSNDDKNKNCAEDREGEQHHAPGKLLRLDALNSPLDLSGDVSELNGFFRRYALAI